MIEGKISNTIDEIEVDFTSNTDKLHLSKNVSSTHYGPINRLNICPF